MTADDRDIHTEHCCFRHGCKYHASLCPVTNGIKKQSHPCEQCMEEALEQEPWKSRLQYLNEVALEARKVPCRKCGLTDELCLCAAKAYIRELEAKIEKLEDDDRNNPSSPKEEEDPYAHDFCRCNHQRRHHGRGTEDNNFDTACKERGCHCAAYNRRPDEPENLYYIQDQRTFVGNSVVWWCPNGKGYTTHIDQAGKYTAEECKTMRDTDVPWRCEDVDKLWSQHVDMQHLRRIPCSNPNCSLPKYHKQQGIPTCDDEK